MREMAGADSCGTATASAQPARCWASSAVVSASPKAVWRPTGSIPSQCREVPQRIAGKISFGDLGEQPGIQRARPLPGNAGTGAFALENRKIETDRMSEHHATRNLDGKFGPCFGEAWGIAHGTIVNTVNARGLRG